ISPIPRFFGCSDSLDYVNRWRSPHAEPPSHSDRKSCSTRREISSPDVVSGSKNLRFALRNCDSSRRSPLSQGFLAVATPSITRITGGAHTRSHPVTTIGSLVQLDARSPPRLWIWVPEHRLYSHPLRFILTPSAKELGITFRTGIRIVYVTTIRNRHSETVDKALVLWNSVLGPKSPPERVSWIWMPEHRRYSHPLRFILTPSAKELGITFRTGIGIVYVTTIRNRHFEKVDKALNRHSEAVDKALVSWNSILGPKFPPERVY
ncbi:hypothetical protein Taro_016015, partial [Colocasia esculenta]|nr:hypothetical protein [Colocasia esculenta]